MTTQARVTAKGRKGMQDGSGTVKGTRIQATESDAKVLRATGEVDTFFFVRQRVGCGCGRPQDTRR